MSGKIIRHDIEKLWSNPDFKEECDRVYVALYRFQEEDKIAYRRLVGMHGGGGGSDDQGFLNIMNNKMTADINAHYGGTFPDKNLWPGPVPNAAYPLDVTSTTELQTYRAFAYTFCWHSAAPFALWHRAFMKEFEYFLQKWDPNNEGHDGANALGAPYWAWETWSGDDLPPAVATPCYTIKSSTITGYTQGTPIRNPFYRWFAPVSIKQQIRKYFPDVMNDANTTTRAAAFTDPNQTNELEWDQAAMSSNIDSAVANPEWIKFCTTGKAQTDAEDSAWGEGGDATSFENAHNAFHNHVGGLTTGGLQGSGDQFYYFPGNNPEDFPDFDNPDYEGEDPDKEGLKRVQYVGTMTSNQSIFDPVFWLHHGNIERQLISWQKLWINPDTGLSNSSNPDSNPTQALKDVVIYPWTKPSSMKQEHFSFNTDVGEHDATFNDWWLWNNLDYEYDVYIEPPAVAMTVPASEATHFNTHGLPLSTSFFKDAKPVAPVVLVVELNRAHYKFGNYVLYYKDRKIGQASVLNASGLGCARCSQKGSVRMKFVVSVTLGDMATVKKALREKAISLKRHRYTVPIVSLDAQYLYKGVTKVKSGSGGPRKRRAT